MPAKRLIVTKELIQSVLPEPPAGYRHSVTKETATIYRVNLHHPNHYVFKENVVTVWGFVKGRTIYTSKNMKCSKVEAGDLLDAGDLPGWTAVTHNVKSLQHIK